MLGPSGHDPHHHHLVAALQAVINGDAAVRTTQAALHQARQDAAAALDAQHSRIANLEHLLATLPSPRPTGQPAPPAEASLPDPVSPATVRALPDLHITCFGRFTVMRGGAPLECCKNRNGQTVLRYLAVYPRHEASADALMDALWPEDPPEIARHKLHCATSALRRTLNGHHVDHREAGYLLYERGVYALNPRISTWIDIDAFTAEFDAGTRAAGSRRVAHFESACRLYTGPFLPEDLYANWPAIRREQLVQMYLTMCGALTAHCLDAASFDDACTWALRILAENRCDESAYRHLILAHAGAGRRAEALRQYRLREQTLAAELGVSPLPETTALLHAALGGTSAASR